MFYAKILRDETTLRWLEDWLGHYGLDDLHDCDALNVSSDEYFISLLKEPPITLEIKKPIPGRTTNVNPYIKRRYFCYDVEINPRSIAHRIMVTYSFILIQFLTTIHFYFIFKLTKQYLIFLLFFTASQKTNC